MSQVISLAPSEIRFMHDTIQPHFRCGLDVNVTINDIYHGRKDLNQIPMIEVTKQGHNWYALDNRRLYLFRVLQKRGYLSHINVRPVRTWDESKLTTKNDGASVRVRGGRQTYSHTFVEETAAIVNMAQISRSANEYGRTPSVLYHPRQELVEQKSRPTSYDEWEEQSCCKGICTIM